MNTSLKLSLIVLLLLNSIAPTLAWQTDRPSASFEIYNQRDQNINVDEEAAIGIGVHVNAYRENANSQPFSGSDGFEVRVVGTANTRKSIEYTHTIYTNLYVDRFLPHETLNLGDNESKKVPVWLYRDIAFYSGPGLQNNSLFREVWISSNGFICFEGQYPNVGPPSEIKDSSPPNNFIAPYWSDLDPVGGTVRFGTENWAGITYFAVEWDNVLDKTNGKRQTFAVLIQMRNVYDPRSQNRIIFQYYNVTWSTCAFWGIEDIEGYKGIGGKYPVGGKSVLFENYHNPAEIREMSIIVEKQDSCAKVYFGTDYWELVGYNLKWKEPAAVPDISKVYGVALKGTATLLMSHAVAWIFGPVAGVVWSGFLIVCDVVEAYAEEYLWRVDPEEMEKNDANVSCNIAYVKVPTAGNDAYDYPVDAEICSQFYWVFTDENTQSHSLKISAQVTYKPMDDINMHNLTTSVEINVLRDIGNNPIDPNVRTVSPETYIAFVGQGIAYPDLDDYYKIYVDQGMVLHLTMTPANMSDFDLYLYNPKGQFIKSSKRGINITEEIYHPTNMSGYWFIRVNAVEGYGLYTLTIDEPCPAPWLTVLTKTEAGVDINNVMVMVGLDRWYTSPVTMPVLPDDYWIYVEPSFVRGHYNYTFKNWNDGETSPARFENIQSNTTLTAYYTETFFNNPPNTPSISGPNYGSEGCPYTYSAKASDPEGDNVYYVFDWNDSSSPTTIGPYNSGATAYAWHIWYSAGTYTVKIYAKDSYGAISGKSSLTVTIVSGGGGDSGGCPILFVWNGTDYICEGLLNIHNPEGIDVIYQHNLVTAPKRVYGSYLFQLVEHPQTHSHVDQVRLYALFEDGSAIKLPLVWAWHSEKGNILPQLLFSDDWRIDTLGAVHNNGVSQSIQIKFLALPPNVKVIGFIFQIEGNNPEFKP